MKWTINMPRVDPAMEKGTIIKILKKVGEKVTKKEIIVKIMTEKVTFDIESPYEGYVTNIYHNEGEELNVGEPILEISEKFEEKEEITERFATPAARKLAREHGIELKQVKGTGPGGRITYNDVLNYIKSSKKEREPQFYYFKKIIADRVLKSYKEIPSVTLKIIIDASNLLEHKQREGFSFDSYFIYLCSRILKQFNLLNSEFKEDKIIVKNEINIAFAFDYNNELYMLVIKNADKKTLKEIDGEHRFLMNKTINNKLTLEDVKDSTFSITNLGMFGIESFNPIIFPGNSGILGIGSVHYLIFNENGKISIKPAISLSLTFDHRIINGAYAARFLKTLKEMAEKGKFEK